MSWSKRKWIGGVVLGLAGFGLLGLRGAERAPRAEGKKEVPHPRAWKELVRAPLGKPPAAAAPTPTLRAGEVHALLQTRIDFTGYDDPKTTLPEILTQLENRYGGLQFDLNEKAFQGEGFEDVRKWEIAHHTPVPPMKAPLVRVLHKILARVPSESGAVYRLRKDGIIEVTTTAALRKELGVPADRPLLPLVLESFDGTPLKQALPKLVQGTDYNVVLDVRADKAAETPVTAELAGVPLDTAVRLLADMAGLEPVRLDNVLYVTRPENAARLRKEQEKRQAAQHMGGLKPSEK